MANIQCPHCRTVIQQPTNVLGIVLGVVAFVVIGLPMLFMAFIFMIAVFSSASERYTELQGEISAAPTAEATFETAPVSLPFDAESSFD